MLEKLRNLQLQAMINKLARQGLAWLAGALAAYGYLTNGSTELFVATGLGLLNLLWMWVNNTPTAIVQQADKLPDVQAVITAPTPEGQQLARAVPSMTVVPAGTVAAKELVK